MTETTPGIREKLTAKFIGDKKFYKAVFAVVVPIIIQEGFTQFVNMLDDLMVGRVGTDQMNGVAIVTQLLLVFNLTVFGGISGVGIFVSQFFGCKNKDGIRSVFKVKLFMGLAMLAGGLLVFTLIPDKLISLYLHEGGDTGNIEATLGFAESYLRIMLIGLVPYVFCSCCTSTLREMGNTSVPMKASVLAVCVNLVFNWLLIFGNLGCPKLGVEGAAIATVISRFVESGFILIYMFTHREKCFFIRELTKSHPSLALVKDALAKSVPIMINELLWSGGMAVLNQCYSTRGLAVVAAVNIASIVNNLLNIVFLSFGMSISIVVGNILGANDMEEAKKTDNRMIFMSVSTSVVIAIIMVAVSFFFPKFYNTTAEVRSLATYMIIIYAVNMPFDAFNNATYFTLRSGGKTLITMLYDCCFVWIVSVGAAFFLSRFTAISILPMFLICRSLDAVKSFIGFFFLKSNMWMNNIVIDKE